MIFHQQSQCDVEARRRRLCGGPRPRTENRFCERLLAGATRDVWERVGGYAVEVAREDFSPRIARVVNGPQFGSTPFRKILEPSRWKSRPGSMGGNGTFHSVEPFAPRKPLIANGSAAGYRLGAEPLAKVSSTSPAKRAVASGSWAITQLLPRGRQ